MIVGRQSVFSLSGGGEGKLDAGVYRGIVRLMSDAVTMKDVLLDRRHIFRVLRFAALCAGCCAVCRVLRCVPCAARCAVCCAVLRAVYRAG